MTLTPLDLTALICASFALGSVATVLLLALIERAQRRSRHRAWRERVMNRVPRREGRV